ncbi:unnamed protein product [Colletotrichum noveboracense]|uniref:Uncharacterized protein n=1 Tax=Colletotrichum noveboracense TaxID=2664923 RepID=A0A9W4WKH6_9PEZI|nr:hypothetical protein K456DRAFT_1717293 [Colletotrichum gloeosporioides 23]CAI0648271.1 unnamed protein product [Colletotrichum noveboracense]
MESPENLVGHQRPAALPKTTCGIHHSNSTVHHDGGSSKQDVFENRKNRHDGPNNSKDRQNRKRRAGHLDHRRVEKLARSIRPIKKDTELQGDGNWKGSPGSVHSRGGDLDRPKQTQARRSRYLATGIPPPPTPAPNLELRAMSIRHHETLGSDTCGFFTVSHDHDLMTRVCDDIASDCSAWGSWLGCGYRPYTTCLGGAAPECAAGKTIGGQTLCCTSASGWLPECQTFLRDDGGLGTKTVLGCRNDDVVWDATVWLHTAAMEALGSTEVPAATSVASSVVLSSASLILSSPTAPLAPTSEASSGSSPTPVGPIVGGVLGGLDILAIAGCIVVWLIVQKKRGTSRPFRRSTVVQELPGNHSPHHEPQTEGWYGQSKSNPASPTSSANTPIARELCEAPAVEKPVQLPATVNSVGSPSKPAELG